VFFFGGDYGSAVPWAISCRVQGPWINLQVAWMAKCGGISWRLDSTALSQALSGSLPRVPPGDGWLLRIEFPAQRLYQKSGFSLFPRSTVVHLGFVRKSDLDWPSGCNCI